MIEPTAKTMNANPTPPHRHTVTEPIWSQVQTHLAHAADLANKAEANSDQAIVLTNVMGSLNRCQQAMTLMSETDQYHFTLLADAHATATAILLQLRSVTEHEDVQQAIDGMIEAYSENLGAAIGWDIRDRLVGNDLLLLANMMNALSEGIDDVVLKREAVEAAHDIAVLAAEYLWHTAESGLARSAIELVAQTKATMKALHVQAPTATPITCSRCGRDNPSGQSFCGECGAALNLKAANVCHTCGHINDLNKRYCTHCGTRLLQRGMAHD